MGEYTKPGEEDIRYFREIAGGDNVVTGGDDLEPYTHDETEDFVFPPDVVVRPGSKEEVAAVMRRCHERSIPVTPRGGGTGLSGGALCVSGGVCLSLDRMNRIIEIDAANFAAVVQPGVVVEELHNSVEELGLMYPPDPASKGSCTIGGNLAECAGGPRALKYGVTRDYVLGLRAVLPDGRAISTGGRLLKNSTGYSLTQLLIGSEGTLAVITEITLRLIPLPARTVSMLATFGSAGDAVNALNSVFGKKIVPCAAEFMERPAIEAAEKMLDRKFPGGPAEAMLLVQLDGNDPEVLARDCELAGETLLAGGAADVLVAESGTKQNELWELRRSVGEAVKKISAYKEEDTVVPRAKLPELVRTLREISARHGLTTICYGHAGDGNIHANVIRGGMTDTQWRDELPGTLADIHRAVVDMGGMISGEHGIGYTQKQYLPIAVGDTEIELMKKIKAVFDPKGILNPGKIFP